MSKEKLDSAMHAISSAAMILRMDMPAIEAFLKECRDMESFGTIMNPTLYRDPERKAASALLEPLFRAASEFLQAYDAQMTKSKTPEETPEGYEMFNGKLMKVINGDRSGWWRFHDHYDRDGYCDNPSRGY